MQADKSFPRWPAPRSSADKLRKPNWTTGAKDGVGTAADPRSRVWFTIASGILTEVFYPRIDQANTRDLRLVLTRDDGFFWDESHDADHEVSMIEPGVPAYRVVNRCRQARYTLEKTIFSDDERAAILIRVRVSAEDESPARVHALLAPHIGNQGAANDGWLGDYKGQRMLFAQQNGSGALALTGVPEFVAGTCSLVGAEDALHELRTNGRLRTHRPHNLEGNLLLAAELPMPADGSALLLALAFGATALEAGQQARSAILQDVDHALDSYVRGWRAFHEGCDVPHTDDSGVAQAFRVSTAMLRTHEDKERSGAIIASLAIPWGMTRGDHDDGGYHLVWPRDLVESAGAFIAAGLTESARLALLYLMSTQEAPGHWPQNMWLSGEAYWRGVQLDEAGLPILLAQSLFERNAMAGIDAWPMVHRAAGYIVRNGPATPEDRWEERAGYSPFTLAVEVSALVAAARFADRANEPQMALYLREIADYWNASIERWTYVTDTALAHELGVGGYYVRLAPPPTPQESGADTGNTRAKRADVTSKVPYESLVSPDALALVRFGLRRPDDPRILNTIRAIDAELRTRTSTGPVWHRFTGDRYGEHKDGSPFNGGGIGRGWPLLAGERAHFELARGNLDIARELQRVMVAQVGRGGLMPEQVWDAADLPDHGLFNGRPTGSAMPLVWAHAEFVKLCRSIADGRIFDMPATSLERYLTHDTPATVAVWRRERKFQEFNAGLTLRLETDSPATVRWHIDSSGNSGVMSTTDSRFGLYFVDVPTAKLAPGDSVNARVEPQGDQEPIEITVRVAEPTR